MFQRKKFCNGGEISCYRKKYLVAGFNFLLQVNIYPKFTEGSDATKTREFGLKFPVSLIKCQRFLVGNTHTPAGKMTPWGLVRLFLAGNYTTSFFRLTTFSRSSSFLGHLHFWGFLQYWGHLHFEVVFSIYSMSRSNLLFTASKSDLKHLMFDSLLLITWKINFLFVCLFVCLR